MRQALRYAVVVLLSVFVLSSCGGGGGDKPDPPPPPPAEAALAVTLDPANGSVQVPALGPYNLKVTVTSVLPANGVQIDVTARKDDGTNSTPYFTSTVTVTTAVTSFTITGTPLATQCLVQIAVSSLSKPSNIWSGSYRYASK